MNLSEKDAGRAWLLSFNEEDRKQYYRDEYSAYLAAVNTKNERLMEHYTSTLRQLQELWAFSRSDVAVMEASVARGHAYARQILDEIMRDPEIPGSQPHNTTRH